MVNGAFRKFRKSEIASGRNEACRFASQLSRILVKSLRDQVDAEGRDWKELSRLGRLALRTLQLRRRILKHRPGPKMSDEKEIARMEVQIRGIMFEIGKMSGRPEPEIARLAEEKREALGKYNRIKKPLEEEPSGRSRDRPRSPG